MKHEFKKITNKNETRYVLETMTAGGTGASSIATAPGRLGELHKRLQELKDKISVPTTKPRNPAGMGSTPGRGTQVHKDKKHDQKMGKEKHRKPFYEQMMDEIEQISELDKPSGSLILKFRGKRLPGDEMMALGYGGFGTTPKDVTTKNAVIKPFHADDAYDVINKIESLFKDKDFVGVEKIILDIPNALSGQLRDVLDYAEQDPERFEIYYNDDDEPEAKTGGKVIGYDADGNRIDRSPAKAQVGGSSRGIANTGMVTVQADSNGQRLISGLVSQGKLSRDTKVQGNKITLRKDDYSKMMSVLGNAKFQQMFTKVGSVAETQGSRPIDKFRSKPSWDDGSEPADKNSPYYVAWSGQAWDDEDTSRPKGDAGRILAINIEDKHTAQELAKHYDQLFKVGKFPDELAHSKYVDYSGTYVGSMRKMDGYEKEMLRYDLRSGIVKDYSKEAPINELGDTPAGRDKLKRLRNRIGQEITADQRDSRSARDKAIHHISHGELKKGAYWSDEADWLDQRAEKGAGRAGGITTRIAKGVAEGVGDDIQQAFQSFGAGISDASLAKGIEYILKGRHQEGENWLRSKKIPSEIIDQLKTIKVNPNANLAQYINDKLVPYVKNKMASGSQQPQSAASGYSVGMSDNAAAKKIASKLIGMPVTQKNISSYIKRYLDMVGRTEKDLPQLSALVMAELEKQGVAEGTNEITSVMQQIVVGELELYDVMNRPRDNAQKQASRELHNMYERIAGEQGLHPDDDFEDIESYMIDELEDRYGFGDEVREGVAGPKSCWPGHRKVGTQPGTGKNKGKRVNDCEKIGEDAYINKLIAALESKK